MNHTVKYTLEEWQTVCEAPVVAALAISLGDSSLLSDIKKQRVFKQYITTTQRYPANALIQAVVTDKPAEPVGASRPTVADCLDVLTQAIRIVSCKEPAQDVQDFKRFLYDLATTVAQASGEGWFGSGERVSPQEMAVLQQLQQALDYSVPTS